LQQPFSKAIIPRMHHASDHFLFPEGNFFITASIKRRYADLPHGQLHYRISGEGKTDRAPLLCFHMSPNNGRIYENLMVCMGTERTVIVPDTPGFGMSDVRLSQPEIRDYA